MEVEDFADPSVHHHVAKPSFSLIENDEPIVLETCTIDEIFLSSEIPLIIYPNVLSEYMKIIILPRGSLLPAPREQYMFPHLDFLMINDPELRFLATNDTLTFCNGVFYHRNSEIPVEEILMYLLHFVRDQNRYPPEHSDFSEQFTGILLYCIKFSGNIHNVHFNWYTKLASSCRRIIETSSDAEFSTHGTLILVRIIMQVASLCDKTTRYKRSVDFLQCMAHLLPGFLRSDEIISSKLRKIVAHAVLRVESKSHHQLTQLLLSELENPEASKIESIVKPYVETFVKQVLLQSRKNTHLVLDHKIIRSFIPYLSFDNLALREMICFLALHALDDGFTDCSRIGAILIPSIIATAGLIQGDILPIHPYSKRLSCMAVMFAQMCCGPETFRSPLLNPVMKLIQSIDDQVFDHTILEFANHGKLTCEEALTHLSIQARVHIHSSIVEYGVEDSDAYPDQNRRRLLTEIGHYAEKYIPAIYQHCNLTKLAEQESISDDDDFLLRRYQQVLAVLRMQSLFHGLIAPHSIMHDPMSIDIVYIGMLGCVDLDERTASFRLSKLLVKDHKIPDVSAWKFEESKTLRIQRGVFKKYRIDDESPYLVKQLWGIHDRPDQTQYLGIKELVHHWKAYSMVPGSNIAKMHGVIIDEVQEVMYIVLKWYLDGTTMRIAYNLKAPTKKDEELALADQKLQNNDDHDDDDDEDDDDDDDEDRDDNNDISLMLCTPGISKLTRSQRYIDDVKMIMIQLFRTLNYLHEVVGIIHGDLKPENLLMILDPKTKRFQRLFVTDFGFSFQIDHKTKRTYAFGTMDFMPPELMKNTYFMHTPALDIYSAGRTCMELVYRSNPTFDKTKTTLKSEIQAKVPVAMLLEKMTDEKPSNRPSLNQCIFHPFFGRMGKLNKDHWKRKSSHIIDNASEINKRRSF